MIRKSRMYKSGARCKDDSCLGRHQRILSMACILLMSIGCMSAWAEDIVELPRDLEIQLALSALPEILRDGATIYVRDPKTGFVLHRKGTNGFTTFVARTSVRFYDAQWPYAYPRDQLIPIAYDKVGAEHHMKPFFDIERMRVEGVPAALAKQTLRKRFNDGTYTAPVSGGLSYMLAPIHRAYKAPAESDEMITASFPHYMPYAPYVIAESLGPMDPKGSAGMLDHGGDNAGPHGYLYFSVNPDEADKIRRQYAGMLDRLCKLNVNWCLPDLSAIK